MARRRLEHEGAKGPKGAERGEREVQPPEPVESPLPWEELTWHGLPMLRCKLCPFDTLEGEAVMIEHIEARHAPPVREARPLVQVYDVYGNPRP